MLDLSCKDWEKRIRAGELPVSVAIHNPREADKMVRIFNQLRLSDIPGQPKIIEAGGDWFQRGVIAPLFGAWDEATQDRLIREVFLLVVKKSGKTSLGALLMLAALVANQRPRAEFLFVGPTKETASRAFSQAVGAIKADDEGFLQQRLHIIDNLKTIVDRVTKATLSIKSFDTSIITGVKPVGTLIDELHELGRDASASRVIGQIRGGMLPNPEGFMIIITTQSDEAPRGVFKTELVKARAIRDGRIKGTMLPVLYEFPHDIAVDRDKWGEPDNWFMVTPNLNRSVPFARLKEEFYTADIAGADEMTRWASQHLNIEIGVGMHTDRWAGAEWWEKRAEKFGGLQGLIKRCEVITCGIDGGGMDDLLGFAAIGREKGTRRWLMWTHAFAHESVLQRRKSISSALKDFEAAGDLTFMADDCDDDVSTVAAWVEEIERSGLLAEGPAIGVDPVGITEIVDELESRGFDTTEGTGRISAVKQGWQLSNIITTFERRLAAGTLVHEGTGLMNWCVGNAKLEMRGNAKTINKAAAGTAKIDPLVAAFMAGTLMARNPANSKSVYEERGIRFA